MAMTTDDENNDFQEMLDSRRTTLHRFVKFTTYTTAVIIVVLVLMAIWLV